MLKPNHFTTVEIKEKYYHSFINKVATISIKYPEFDEDSFHKFEMLVKDQFSYGGKKYAFSGEKESTDLITERFGIEWILGTCYKYINRYRNLKRERDLLKVAAYQYITWLQMGFQFHNGTVSGSYKTDKVENYLENVLANLELFPERPFENTLIYICVAMYICWVKEGFAKVAEHDTDTWNEGKDK